MSTSFFDIDGSVLEGGGQILRNAIALSVILGIPIKITKIRAGRTKPGLSRQHLESLKLSANLCNGHLSSCELGSTEISFTPDKIQGGSFSVDAQGAGGFYPRGGGHAIVTSHPLKEAYLAITLVDSGTIDRIYGYCFCAGRVPLKIARESRDLACKLFKNVYKNCKVEIDYYREDDNRCFGDVFTFLFIAQTSTGCRLALSDIGNQQQQQSRHSSPCHLDQTRQAVDKLHSLTDCDACCDDYCQDQLILLMALANGRSQLRTGPLTLHTQTAIAIVQQLLPNVKFRVEPVNADGQANIITCDGAGHRAPLQECREPL